MTADIKMLPLPDIERYEVVGDIAYPINSDPNGDYVEYDGHVSAMADYARAVAEHSVKERDAEIEALRAEVLRLRTDNSESFRDAAILANIRRDEAEAEIEALRALLLEACDDGDEADADLLATLERARTAETRAERLAEALRDIESRPWNGVRPIQIAARAALRDHDQEKNGND